MKINLNIGKTIVTLMSGVTELKKFCPVVAIEGVQYPFAVYSRTSTTTNDSKDLSGIVSASVDISIVDDNYDRSLTVAQKVIDTLSHKRGTYGDIELISLTVDNTSEDFQNDAYIQNINLTVKYS